MFLDLYVPIRKPKRPLPIVIYLHGGGWLQGSKDNCPGAIFVQHGYAMACVAYRFSDRAIFPAQIQDVKRAVRWLRENAVQYNLNRDQIGAWGWSAGGHLSALLATSSGVAALEQGAGNPSISSAIQAACSWYPPTDFTQVPPAFAANITEADWDKYRDRPWFAYTVATTKLLGGAVTSKPELTKLANPITHIDPQDPPMLIIHGEKDSIVPISQSELLVKALQAKGVEVTFSRDSNLEHSYQDRDQGGFNRKLLKQTLKFFDRHLSK